MYKQVKLLGQNCTDISFCIYFILQILLLIKRQPGLFKEDIDCSEWDYIVKFWGVIAKRLFYESNLRLKWSDTQLALYNTISDVRLKVDRRILNDKINQRYNIENDISVMDVKFVSDRCKLSIENKTIIDKFLLDGVKITSIDSLQIPGLDFFFFLLTLVLQNSKKYKIDNTMKNIEKYMDLATNLLCFRDECVFTSNNKRPIDDLRDDELTVKQESIRDTWIPPRTPKSPPSEVPRHLWKEE
ncbi:hypothetical protein BDF21DRAFT_441288 [Thamnidium elegans]|nr:hypothetical protein BDF21DRAFT_441288 [Thamnidium elegans]